VDNSVAETLPSHTIISGTHVAGEQQRTAAHGDAGFRLVLCVFVSICVQCAFCIYVRVYL
jgi:hypothetical protein